MSSYPPSSVSRSAAQSPIASVYRAEGCRFLTRVAFHPLRNDMIVVGLTPPTFAPKLAIEVSSNMAARRPITALDVSPQSDLDRVELVVATAVPRLYRLKWSEATDCSIDRIGAGMVTSMIQEVKYARAGGAQASRTVASVGDQGALLLWDTGKDKPELIKVIPHPFPLRTLSYHPTNPSLIMTGDSRGMLRLIDIESGQPRLSLYEPRSLARSIRGDLVSLDWNSAAPAPTSQVGAVIDGRWALWDLNQTEGGGPTGFGSVFSETLAGRTVFRWHPNDPKIFAVLSCHANASPALTLHHTSFPHAPRPIDIAPKPLEARDMCWSPHDDILAVIVERDVLFFNTRD